MFWQILGEAPTQICKTSNRGTPLLNRREELILKIEKFESYSHRSYPPGEADMSFLQLIILLPLTWASQLDCSTPPEYPYSVSRIEQGILFTFAMSDSVFTTGDPVGFYYNFQNMRADAVHFSWPNQQFHEFSVVYPHTCSEPEQPGCTYVFHYPQVVLPAVKDITLAPGECYPFTFLSFPLPKGRFRAFARLQSGSAVFDLPEISLLALDLEVVEPTDVSQETWGSIKVLYKD